MLQLNLFVVFLFCKSSSAASVIVLNDKNETIVSLPSVTAAFGPSLYNRKLWGHVLLTKPSNACSLVEPPDSHNSSLPLIGLVQRYECSFVAKVLNAQQAGFTAVLVYDPSSDELTTMSGSSDFVIIPSMFIGKSSKEILSRYLGLTNIVGLEDHFPSSFGFLLLPLIVALLLSLVFILFFSLIRYFSGVVNQWRHRLSRSVLKLLPLKRFKKGDSYEVCAVCLEDFKINDKLRLLPCSHAYHQSCIDPWLTENKRTCPLCNKQVFSGSQEVDDPVVAPDEQTPLMSQTINRTAPSVNQTPSRFVNEELPSTSRLPAVEI